MAFETTAFETLIPSRFVSFTLPISSFPCPPGYFHTNVLHISVLDSPTQPTGSPKIAAMLVPIHRQNDWIFTTEAGHLQLLITSPGISRLVLIGNPPNPDKCPVNICGKYGEHVESFRNELERSLYPLLMALLPKEIAKLGNFDVPFLSYEDNLIGGMILEKCIGPCVGEMLVEDVEIQGLEKEFRRRLRFKRMPNFVQTEIRVLPICKVGNDGLNTVQIGETKFCPDLRVLVHPYLAPMVAGVSLIGGSIRERLESGIKPKCLCIGVGGGALVSFLYKQLDFDVVGVEEDEIVLSVAKKYFGLETGKGIRVHIGDGIDVLKKMVFGMDGFVSKFDVIMVDLDSSDSKLGVSAPPSEFMQKDVLVGAKSSLSKHGILILNVIPTNRSFYDVLIHELGSVFVELYEIDCGNEENFVLIASMSSIDSSPGISENSFMRKLKSVIPGVFFDSIRKI